MKLIKKKRIMAFTLALALIFSLVPGVKSRADVGRMGESRFTVTKVGTSSEEVSADTDMQTYIGAKRQEFIEAMMAANVGIVDANVVLPLFSAENGNYKYARFEGANTAPKMIEGVLTQSADVRYTEITVTLADQGATTQKINEINITVGSPEIGSTIVDESTKPSITLESGANYTVTWTMFVNNYPSVDPTYDSGSIFGTEIKEGEYYYFEVFLAPKEGYEFDTSDNVSVKVNGGTDFELGYCGDVQFAVFSRVKAVAPAPTVYNVKFETGEGSKVDLQEIESGKTATKPGTNPTRTGFDFGGWYADEDWKTEFDFSKPITADTTVYAKWTKQEKKPTYTILDGANQTIENESGKDLVVRASGEVDKLKALNIDGKVVDEANRTITNGSTIATIKAAFLDTLTEGEHTLTFVYTDGEVSTSFTTKKHTDTTPATVTTTPAEVTTPATTEAAKKTTAASPKTGDSLPVVPMALLMVVSLIGILLMKKHKVK